MSPALVQRQAALAAVALLATLGVLALGSGDGGEGPVPLSSPGLLWDTAIVGVIGARAYERPTSCGTTLDQETLGVAHPFLPCGVDLVLAFKSKLIRTEVVDRRPVGGFHDFDLTQALAKELGVESRETIKWQFAK